MPADTTTAGQVLEQRIGVGDLRAPGDDLGAHDGLLGQGFEDLLRQSVRQSGCVLAQPGAHVPGPGGLELARGRVPA